MVLESNVKNNCLVVSFNSPKTSNSISADDWKELKEKIKEFEKNKGYGTREHLNIIQKYGVCDIHRLSFNLGPTQQPQR